MVVCISIYRYVLGSNHVRLGKSKRKMKTPKLFSSGSFLNVQLFSSLILNNYIVICLWMNIFSPGTRIVTCVFAYVSIDANIYPSVGIHVAIHNQYGPQPPDEGKKKNDTCQEFTKSPAYSWRKTVSLGVECLYEIHFYILRIYVHTHTYICGTHMCACVRLAFFAPPRVLCVLPLGGYWTRFVIPCFFL